MLQIRRGVFETNSSSTHSITIAPKDEFDAWVAGDVYFNIYGSDTPWMVDSDDKWLTRDGAIVRILDSKYPPKKPDDSVYTYDELYHMSDDELDDILYGYGIASLKEYMQPGGGIEYYDQVFFLGNGDEYVAFGQYGTDY